MKNLLLVAAIISLASCKSNFRTAYKVTDKQTGSNYYTNDVYIDYNKDSIFFAEFKRNGDIRRNGAFKLNEVNVEEKR